MNEDTSKAVTTILSWVPKPVRIVVGVIVALAIILFIWLYFIERIGTGKKNNKICGRFTLKGSLVTQPGHIKMADTRVQLESYSTSEVSTSKDGIFVMEGITLPESKIITLVITDNQNKVSRIKDIDLNNNTKYPVSENCVIDLQSSYVQTEPEVISVKKKGSDTPDKRDVKRGHITRPGTTSDNNINRDSNSKIRVAILPFEYISENNKYSWLSKAMPETLLNVLSKIDRFDFVESLQRDKILNEINFQQGKYVEVSTAVRIGKLLGAGSVILGACQVVDGEVQINARIVNVETGKVDNSSVTSLNGPLQSALQTQTNFSNKMYSKISESIK